MSDNQYLEIVNRCLILDSKAVSIFAELAAHAEDETLGNFWRKMSDEEKEHVGFWRRVLELIHNGMLPEVFDEPGKIIAELETVEFKIDRLWGRYQKDPSLLNAFLLAYRMEFYMLHQAFETIFNFMSTIPGEANLFDAYEVHIQDFVDMFIAYGKVTPELEILGEALQKLWKKYRELSVQISIDELTGILNRRGFFNAAKPLLHLAQRHHQTVGIMMVDIDDFKKVNDTHGHQIGDEVLKTTAQVMQKNIRASDIAGRYGGEEFIILFSTVEKESIYQLAEKLRTKIKDETSKTIPVTISIGVAADRLNADVEKGVMSLIKEADDCLYDAKRAGKNKVVMCRVQ
jgi:diguanylate cyclase (GGDEF)-like protein